MFKIAVITPCYNAQKYIYDCLLSVSKSICFGEFEYEHIVVDDGSTDKSWELIEAFDGLNVKKFHFLTNKGHSTAKNYAISKTDANYFLSLDSDDVIFQNTLRFASDLLKNKSREWLNLDYICSGDNLSYLFENDYFGWDFRDCREALFSLLKADHYFPANSFISREIFDRVGSYDETLRRNVDTDLYVRMLNMGFFPYYYPYVAFMYRHHDSNMTRRHWQGNNNLRYQDRAEIFIRHKIDIKKSLNPEQFQRLKTLYNERLGLNL